MAWEPVPARPGRLTLPRMLEVSAGAHAGTSSTITSFLVCTASVAAASGVTPWVSSLTFRSMRVARQETRSVHLQRNRVRCPRRRFRSCDPQTSRLWSAPVQQLRLLRRASSDGKHRLHSDDPRQLHRRHPGTHREHSRLLVSLLQRSQGQVSVRHTIFLHYPPNLVRNGFYQRNRRVAAGNREYGHDVVPLLPAVTATNLTF